VEALEVVFPYDLVDHIVSGLVRHLGAGELGEPNPVIEQRMERLMQQQERDISDAILERILPFVEHVIHPVHVEPHVDAIRGPIRYLFGPHPVETHELGVGEGPVGGDPPGGPLQRVVTVQPPKIYLLVTVHHDCISSSTGSRVIDE
jgi:hypothetical protein